MTDSEQNKQETRENPDAVCPHTETKKERKQREKEEEKAAYAKMTGHEKFKKIYKEWILPFGLEIIALWLLVHFVCFLPVVPTGSMEPTIAEHSMLFAWRVHNPEKLERGDVVVFDSEELGGKNLIKRLVGLPGDTVEILEDGSMLLNGEPCQEEYVVNQMAIPSYFEVPEGHYLFMGDNRANSYDSRYWEEPYIPGSAISGRAVFTLFPFQNFGTLK